MSVLFNYIKRSSQEKWLLFLVSIALFIYVFAVLRLPLWDVFNDTSLGLLLVNDPLSTLLSGISGSVVAAYIFHFISSVIPTSKDSYIAEEKLKDAYDSTLSNICFHYLTFEQSQRFNLPSGGTKYTQESLILAQVGINHAQVFNGNDVINTNLSKSELAIHFSLVDRFEYITGLMQSRSMQFLALEAFYKYFDARTIDEVQKIKFALGGVPSRPSFDTKQARHSLIINAHRGIVKLLNDRKIR